MGRWSEGEFGDLKFGDFEKGKMVNWGERYMVLESGCGIWEGIVGVRRVEMIWKR
jgi:hypothetical protein